MAEADPLENNNDTLLSGLERGDLTTGVYEGGFKTWECALDLASFVSQISLSISHEDWHIIELGAGSAIPSLAVLSRLVQEIGDTPTQKFHFSICDYNEDVLRLVTAPNIFLARQHRRWDKTTNSLAGLDEDKDELETDDIDESQVQSFLSDLAERQLSFDFVSGAWGNEFLGLIEHNPKTDNKLKRTLILASETIYSPTSIKPFTDTLITLLRRGGSGSKAYVAAKRVYFGVGGGVDEFVREATSSGALVKETVDIRNEGVGRVILEVTLPGY